jgi:hypothetical protein
VSHGPQCHLATNPWWAALVLGSLVPKSAFPPPQIPVSIPQKFQQETIALCHPPLALLPAGRVTRGRPWPL